MKRSTRLQRPGLLGGSTANTLLDADGPQPSLNLDFASGILDPRITFTRSTVGTYYRGQFNQNLLVRSQEFDNTSAWQTITAGTGVAPIRVANNAVAPDGTMTADTITFNTAAGTTASDRSELLQTFSVPASTYTCSVWIRGTVGGEKLTIRHVGNGAYTTITASTEWQRFTVTETGNFGFLFLGIRQSVPNVINSTATVELWGAQLTEGSLLTPYIPTTTAAITQGQIASADINVPRFENDPVTGEARGLLIESTVINLCIRSEEFDTWSKVAAGDIVTANAGTAPDGLVTADKIIADTTSGAHGVNRSVTTTGSTTYTQSVFVKAAGWNWVYMTEGNTLTATAWFNLANGTVGTVSGTGTPSAKIQHIGNGWYRCTLTFTTNAGQVNANIQVRPTTGDNVFTGYVGNGVDGILAWGAQVEAQAFASSYIPTTTIAITRGNDVTTIAGSAFSPWYNQTQGTFFANFTTTFADAATQTNFILALDGSGSKRVMYFSSGQSRVDCFDGATIITVNADFTGIPVKAASAYSASERALCANASAVAVGTVAAGYSSATSLSIGSGAASFNGVVRSVGFWPTRLPNDTLQRLTT